MSRARAASFLVAALVLLTAAFFIGRQSGRAPSNTPPSQAQQTPRESPGVVTVSPQAQEQSGFATATVEPTVLHPAATAYAIALDVRPLLMARKQISTAQADVRSAEAVERASRAEYERTRKLFADDRNVSQKAMQAAEAAWRTDQGKLEAAAAALHESEAAAVQQLGPALAGGQTSTSVELRRIAAHEEGLVQVMLPATSDATPPVITISAAGYPSSKARRIGPAPQVDPGLAGRSFLYGSDAVYPAGLRLHADVPLGANAVPGFVVPESAVVWYGNEPWVFVQAAPDRFVRKALKEPQAVAAGMFTTTRFESGERIVTRGAQLLESEALRPKTPAASGCSDPECDD